MQTTTTRLIRLSVSVCLLLLISCARKTTLQGKVVIAEQKLHYLVQQTILLKTPLRTVSAAKIDRFGYFEFRNVRKRNNYSIDFDSLPKALDGSVFYLANLNGKKIKEINLKKDFSFRLLPVEFYGLASLQDDDLEAMVKAYRQNPSGIPLLVKKFINYETGSFLISEEYISYMNTLVKLLKNNDQFMLRVNSHADATGDDEFNRVLSVKRAGEIKNYLVAKGISAERILTYGYGETKPLNNCTNGVACSELQHRQNRRTEFVFTMRGTKKPQGEVAVD